MGVCIVVQLWVFAHLVVPLGSTSTSKAKNDNHFCHYDNRLKKTVCGSGGQHKDDTTRLPPTAHVLEEKSLLKSVAGQSNYDFFNDHAAAEKAGAANANWDYLSHTTAEDAEAEQAWTSSWDPDAASHGYVELCEPFQQLLAADYVPTAAQQGRAPVRCLLAQHQGLGDQIKGVMRCWAAALLTQRPLVMDHSRSRSSWLWADDASILPARAVRGVVFFNGSKVHGIAPPSPTDKHGTEGFKAHSHSAPKHGGRALRSGSGSSSRSLRSSRDETDGGLLHLDSAVGRNSSADGNSGGGSITRHRRRLRLSATSHFESMAPSSPSISAHDERRFQQHLHRRQRRLAGLTTGIDSDSFPTERQIPTGSKGGGHGSSHHGHNSGHGAGAVDGRDEVEVGQSFARPEGLLPCSPSVGVRVGGIKPFLGTKPARYNLDGSARADPKTCAPVVEAADRLMAALQKSRGDEAYCLVRSLLEPSPQQRAGLRRFLGRAALDAAKGQLAGPALPKQQLESANNDRADRKKKARARRLSTTTMRPLGPPPSTKSTPVVGLHLRLQEQISTDHDVNWGLYCAEQIARQFAIRGNGGAGSSVVLFVLATDTPSLLPRIAEELKSSAVCKERRCAFASNEGVGTVGHISNKGTAGKSSVSQRNWADWFLLSEATACIYSRSGFPRMACQASHHRAANRGRLFEKSSCGSEGRQAWRNAATDVEPLESGCNNHSKALATKQCILTKTELGKWS